MKTRLFFLVVLISILCNLAMAKADAMNNIDIAVEKVSQNGRVLIAISNKSRLPINIWAESNSWGAARWRILIVKKGKHEIYFQNPDQRFTRNFPAFDQVGSGQSVERTLELNGGNWCLMDRCSSHDERGIRGREIRIEPTDDVYVIYDVPRTDEAIKLAVWYGVLSAKKS